MLQNFQLQSPPDPLTRGAAPYPAGKDYSSHSGSMKNIITQYIGQRTDNNSESKSSNKVQRARYVCNMSITAVTTNCRLRIFTSCVRYNSRGEMYIGHDRLCVCVSVCPSPHSHTTARTRMSPVGMVEGAL